MSCCVSILGVFLKILDAVTQKIKSSLNKENVAYIWEKTQTEAQVLFQIFKPSNSEVIKIV